MDGYKFPLQKLLDMRASKETESEREFVEAQRQKRLTEEKLESLKDSYKRFNVEKAEDNLVTRRIKENYLSALTNNIADSKRELVKKMEHVEDRREDLRQRQIDRKTVETLKDKRYETFKKEQEDKERKTNDEFALYSYIRNIERR